MVGDLCVCSSQFSLFFFFVSLANGRGGQGSKTRALFFFGFRLRVTKPSNVSKKSIPQPLTR